MSNGHAIADLSDEMAEAGVPVPASAPAPRALLDEPVSAEEDGPENLEQQHPKPLFWSWPLVTDIAFTNRVSEARDLLAGERNFLIAIKGSFALAVSGCALLLQPAGTASRFDTVISYLLLGIALILPVVSLYSYARSFNLWICRQGAVHNPTSFVVMLVCAGVVVLVLNIKELASDGQHVNLNYYYHYNR